VKTYTVTALLVGKVTRDRHYEKCHCNPDMGKLVIRPVYVYLVEGPGDDIILINTGCPSALDGKGAWAPEEYDQPLPEGGGPQAVERALATVGLGIGDITRVIMTHLHTEAAWNTDLFPNAQLIVQRDEVEAAFSPPSWQRLLYPRKAALDVQARKKPERCLLLWGDTEIAEGITLLKTPGLTHGTQTPVVNTEKGRVAITAAGTTYANWYPADERFGFPLKPMSDTVNIPGTFVLHPWKVTHNMERIREHSDIIVPIHDESAPRSIPDEWWQCPDDEELARSASFAATPFSAGGRRAGRGNSAQAARGALCRRHVTPLRQASRKRRRGSSRSSARARWAAASPR
jgi:N-acyl homoserine lactone hydrolase